jgi:hypothetical protein
MARTVNLGVILEWDESQVHHFLRDPNGPLGVELLHKLGEIVLAGAKRRALRRTGAMANAMRVEYGQDEQGMYADIVSPVHDPKTNKPYAIFHEAKKVRDRRPHRSLRPALNDIRKILTRG